MSFENIFCRIFHLDFAKNLHENSIGKTFLGCSYHLNGITEYSICYPQPLSHHPYALTTELSGWTMRYASFWFWIFQNVSGKTNQTVLFLFPNLSKNSQAGSTCAVCSKFLWINDLTFQFLIKNLCITGVKSRFLDQ